MLKFCSRFSFQTTVHFQLAFGLTFLCTYSHLTAHFDPVLLRNLIHASTRLRNLFPVLLRVCFLYDRAYCFFDLLRILLTFYCAFRVNFPAHLGILDLVRRDWLVRLHRGE